MKRDTDLLPKFANFMQASGLPKYAALGVLEGLWLFTARFAKRGDIGRYSDAEIAHSIGWDKDPGALIQALVNSRWLDISAEHRLTVHDWDAHAPDYVHLYLFRGGLLFVSGAKPRSTRLAKRERNRVLSSQTSLCTPPEQEQEQESERERKKNTHPPDARVQPLLRYFSEQYALRHGHPYPGQWARDGKLIRRIPKGYDVATLKRCIDLFFEDRDPFLEKAGYTLGMFSLRLAALVGKLGAARPEVGEDLAARLRREGPAR